MHVLRTAVIVMGTLYLTNTQYLNKHRKIKMKRPGTYIVLLSRLVRAVPRPLSVVEATGITRNTVLFQSQRTHDM